MVFIKNSQRLSPLEYSNLKGYFYVQKNQNMQVDKWIKEGCGSGMGSDYKPWLKIQDVSSLGRSPRLKGIKTNTHPDFLSEL